jgi:putative addiction module component (TIGR02574 family)
VNREVAMPNAADFEHLPVAEKVELITQLWDQIAKSGQPIAMPMSVVAEAERRLDELIADPSLGITEDEMWRRANVLRN